MLAVTSLIGCVMAASASAQTVTIGVNLGVTGPTASVAIPAKNAVEVMPREIGNVQIKYVVLDDGGDPGHAVKNMRELIEEYQADVVLGASSIPVCMAQREVALQTKTPQICLAPVPTNAFTFTVAQSPELMVEGVVEDMVARNYKTVGYIGFADSLGDHNYQALVDKIAATDIKVTANERFNRTDTSVTSQVVKVMLTNPDAIFVSASGTPAALPQIELNERGYRGQTYFLHGVINRDFLRVGGKALNGSIAAAGPFAVAAQLPDTNPIKAEALAFRKLYDGRFGEGAADTFAALGWDGFQLIRAALPKALASARPGTLEFREALRDALEQVSALVGADGVYTLGPSDHNGLDRRARIMVTVKDGAFRPLQ
jgi:branched-chain amino acid transport system substrate-binding protein